MIVCVNTYEIPPNAGEKFERAFGEVVELLRQKPGFCGVRLHRSNDGSGKYMTYAEWESLEHQKEAGKDAALAPKMKAVLAIARPSAEWYDTVLDSRRP